MVDAARRSSWCAAIVLVTVIGALVWVGAAGASSASHYLSGRHCKVPRVAGLTVREARPKLEKAGCKLGARHPKHLGPKAVVIATSPQTGAVRPFGTKVSLFLRIR